jgi:NAD(P)H-hydrate epimerase
MEKTTRLPAPLLRRDPEAHKNDFGHALIIAGSARMLGAGCLSALSALRAGSGLVTLAVPRSLVSAAQKKTANEVMILPLPETGEGVLSARALGPVERFAVNCRAAAIGPGIGKTASAEKLAVKIIERLNLPLVVDADGLNALSRNLAVLDRGPRPRVLTPHPGEMARLAGHEIPEALRKNEVTVFMNKHPGCVLLLKGRRTLVGEKGRGIYINKTGNSGMATAGSGDVLTGVITGLLAQGLSAFDAAVWGARLHGMAGDMAALKITRAALIATDIINHLPPALRRLGA